MNQSDKTKAKDLSLWVLPICQRNTQDQGEAVPQAQDKAVEEGHQVEEELEDRCWGSDIRDISAKHWDNHHVSSGMQK